MSKKIDTDTPESITFHYMKSAFFRVMHVDGVLGSITPNGHINCVIFSERPSIPKLEEYELKKSGELGDQINYEGRQGFVREMDADLVMDYDTAKELKDILSNILKEVDKLKGSKNEISNKKNK